MIVQTWSGISRKCSRLVCLSQSAEALMSQRRSVPLLLLYTNRWQWWGWNSAAVITSVRSSMFAGLMSTICEKKLRVEPWEGRLCFSSDFTTIHSHNAPHLTLTWTRRLLLSLFYLQQPRVVHNVHCSVNYLDYFSTNASLIF